MLLAIAILIVSVLLTLMQFLRLSYVGLKVAGTLAFMLLSLGIWNVIEQHYEQKQYIAALERIATRIDWQQTKAYVDLLNDPSSIAAEGISALIKIVPPGSPLLRSIIDEQAIRLGCGQSSRQSPSTMHADIAEKVYRAFEDASGSIYTDVERKAGIEHLFYSGRQSGVAPGGNARINLTLDRGPVATSNIRGLSDLNGKVLVALLQAPASSSALLSSLELDLDTNAGHYLLTLAAPFAWKDGLPRVLPRTLATKRFVGVCIPAGFFRNISE